MRIEYIPSTDTYYFPNKEVYVKRWMFLYADPDYLAHMLGLDFLHKDARTTLFTLLSREEEHRPRYIDIVEEK